MRSRSRSGRKAASGIATLVVLLGSAGGCGSAEPASPADPTAEVDALSLVAVGDSIPFDSPDDCPGCTSFVDRYAEAAQQATGRPVEVTNLAQHTGLTVSGLLGELDDVTDDLAGADLIVVGIAQNSIELYADRPCAADLVDDQPDWSVMTVSCAEDTAEAARPEYEQLFSTVADLRAGKPTVLRTIDRYNDWIGWAKADLTPEQDQITADFISRWNDMVGQAVTSNGFGCADISTAVNGSDGRQPSGELLADGYIHPSDHGNAVIAEELEASGFDPLVG